MSIHKLLQGFLVALLIGYAMPAISHAVSYRDASSLQQAVDQAPPHSTVIVDRASQIEITSTVRITKPLTLVGLNARLQPGLGRTPILEVLSEGVHLRDFVLEGNNDTVGQDRRAALVVVRRGRFVIENGETNNSTKDGIMISPLAEYGDIEHGVVRNLTARNTIRDAVSISGAGEEGLFVRHLVVENIRAYDSALRGPVEVSDGSEYITVRDIYAESCAYGVDVQDHNKPGQVNRHITIDGVHAKDCEVAIRTANSDFGHHGLTIRNVSVEGVREGGQRSGDLNRATSTPRTPAGRPAAGQQPPRGTSSSRSLVNDWRPIHVRNTADVVIENVRIYGCPGEPCLFVENSTNVTVRNVSFVDANHSGASMLVQDTSDLLIDNVVFRGAKKPEYGVRYRIVSDEHFRALRIRNVLAEDVRTAGIVLENASESGTLDSYLLSDNVSVIQIDLEAEQGLERNNMKP